MTTSAENARPTSSIATFSLVIGIGSLVLSFLVAAVPIIGFLGGLVALILGIMALREIKTQSFQGRGSAVGGIITGSLSIAWFLFAIFVLAPAVKNTFDAINNS